MNTKQTFNCTELRTYAFMLAFAVAVAKKEKQSIVLISGHEETATVTVEYMGNAKKAHKRISDTLSDAFVAMAKTKGGK